MKMTQIKYAIKCSTEEQARECIPYRFIFDEDATEEDEYEVNDMLYRDGYTVITYEEAKELGLLGTCKETLPVEPQQFDSTLTYEQILERGRQIGYKEGRRDRSKTTVKDVLLYEAGLKDGQIKSEDVVEKIMNGFDSNTAYTKLAIYGIIQKILSSKK